MAGSDDPLILPSARKHGVTDGDLLHAYRNPVPVWDLGDNGQMLVGPARNGTLLQVGVDQVIDHPDVLVIFHGMRARAKFLPPRKPRDEGDDTDAEDIARDRRPRGRHVDCLR